MIRPRTLELGLGGGWTNAEGEILIADMPKGSTEMSML